MSATATFINRVLRKVQDGVFQVLVNDEVMGVVARREDDGRWAGLAAPLEAEDRWFPTPQEAAARLCERLEDHYEDAFFVVTEVEEPEDYRYVLTMAARGSGRVLECFGTDDPYGNVEAFRLTQVFSFEERMSAEFEERWSR